MRPRGRSKHASPDKDLSQDAELFLVDVIMMSSRQANRQLIGVVTSCHDDHFVEKNRWIEGLAASLCSSLKSRMKRTSCYEPNSELM